MFVIHIFCGWMAFIYIHLFIVIVRSYNMCILVRLVGCSWWVC